MWMPSFGRNNQGEPPMTSESHPLQIDFFMRPAWRNSLGMSQLPGKQWSDGERVHKRSIPVDIAAIVDAKVGLVISLLETWEYEATKTNALPVDLAYAGIAVKLYPIVDRSIPTNLQTFDVLIREILDNLYQGRANVLVHCKAGVGRTGLVASCVLIRDGVSAKDAIDTVQATREGTITNEFQQRFVYYYESFLYPDRVPCPSAGQSMGTTVEPTVGNRRSPWVDPQF